MQELIKYLSTVVLIVAFVILPFYLWQVIDCKSYEDFLLKSISPLS